LSLAISVKGNLSMIVVRKARGRPRKEGARHPSGQLVQKVEPNAKVVEIRRALLGDAPLANVDRANVDRANVNRAMLAQAESPMALALARGWISAEQHQAGQSYAAAWRRSHPQRRAVGLEETQEPAARDLRRLGQMSDAEITTAFQAILDATDQVGPPSEESQVEARVRYNAMSRSMTADEQNEVFLCFCLASWPQWILQRCAGRWETSWERKHRLLVSGLETLAGLRRPRPS